MWIFSSINLFKPPYTSLLSTFLLCMRASVILFFYLYKRKRQKDCLHVTNGELCFPQHPHFIRTDTVQQHSHPNRQMQSSPFWWSDTPLSAGFFYISWPSDGRSPLDKLHIYPWVNTFIRHVHVNNACTLTNFYKIFVMLHL